MREDDDRLVERAQRGETEAFGEIVTRYQAVAQRTAFVITRDAETAQDAVQEAFVKAYRALGRFHHGAPLRPWLLRIVANEAINRAKAGSRHLTLDLSAAESRAADPEGSPEAQAVAAERRESILHALNAMRDDDRLVIAYRYFFDLSEAEMAEVLDIPRGTVKSRLSRALGRLREQLRG